MSERFLEWLCGCEEGSSIFRCMVVFLIAPMLIGGVAAWLAGVPVFIGALAGQGIGCLAIYILNQTKPTPGT